ncbi:MAG: hypothetical protein AAF667_19895 [Pseudomonadota bacterium]
MLKSLSLAAVIAVSATSASAATYTFENADSFVSGMITGTFDYDPLAEVYSSASVDVGGNTYSNIVPGFSSSQLFLTQSSAVDLTSAPVLELDFDGALNGDGRLTGIDSARVGICGTADCSLPVFPAVVDSVLGGVRGPDLGPKLWTFSNASSITAGSVQGSFVYDGATGTFSDVSVTSNGILFDALVPNGSGEVFVLSDDPDAASFALFVEPGTRLDNAGGTRTITALRQGACVGDCSLQAYPPVVEFPVGMLVASVPGAAVVPLPPTGALLMSVAGFGFLLRRRRRA